MLVGQNDRIVELGYDDGFEPNLKLTFLFNGGYRFVTRFTPPITPAQLIRIRYFLADTAKGSSFYLHILEDNFNAPKHEPSGDMIDSVRVSGGRLGWNEYDLRNRNIIVEGDFYIGLYYDLQSKLSIGAENREPVSNRVYDSDCCSWWVREDLDLYIHAVLRIPYSGAGKPSGSCLRPENLDLIGNYPNPFNHSTLIRYRVSKPGRLTLALFDAMGREVKWLVDSEQQAGTCQIVWDGTDQDGHPVTTGVYWCRLADQDETVQHKILLVR
jgi:hypothetical protein